MLDPRNQLIPATEHSTFAFLEAARIEANLKHGRLELWLNSAALFIDGITISSAET